MSGVIVSLQKIEMARDIKEEHRTWRQRAQRVRAKEQKVVAEEVRNARYQRIVGEMNVEARAIKRICGGGQVQGLGYRESLTSWTAVQVRFHTKTEEWGQTWRRGGPRGDATRWCGWRCTHHTQWLVNRSWECSRAGTIRSGDWTSLQTRQMEVRVFVGVTIVSLVSVQIERLTKAVKKDGHGGGGAEGRDHEVPE